MYIIGGSGNHEHWHAPDVIAGQLSNFTCEGCVTYNMLKLTRLLHFHQQDRTDLLDYYERALFNQMLGTQDPDSAHGFNCYYTGLSPGAFKRLPLNYFPYDNPDAYETVSGRRPAPGTRYPAGHLRRIGCSAGRSPPGNVRK
jgi:DUF1680 family protein